jgi:hypothetical protein
MGVNANAVCFGLVAAQFGATFPAAAQFVSEAAAEYSLTVREIDRVTGAPSAATPGVIDPTEAVRFGLNVSFTPPIGRIVSYSPANPPPGTGAVAGWAGTALQLVGQGGTDGTFTRTGLAPGFQPVVTIPKPGGLDYFGAFSPALVLNTGEPINQANPIVDFIGITWIPTDYTPRSVSFFTRDPSEGLAHHIGLRITIPGGPQVYLSCFVPAGSITHGQSGPITIVPAPGSLIVIAAGSACAGRRRRLR